MARTVGWGSLHPYYNPPNLPPNEPRPTPITNGDGKPLDQSLFPGFNDFVYAVPIGKESKILIPKTFDDDDAPDAYWHNDGDGTAQKLFKTCIAYEEIGEEHPRLLRYLARDPWTGLPTFVRPSGPPLVGFVGEHRAVMYPPDLADEYIRLAPAYQPLILSWSLHLLSALRFIHEHNIIFGKIDHDCCWLSSDLSLSLVGFYDADFRDEFGFWSRSWLPGRASVKSDIYGWATFLFLFLTEGEYHDWPQNHEVSGSPDLPDRLIAREVLRKCCAMEYENADDVWRDFEAALKESGYEVDGDSLKELDPLQLVGSADGAGES
jgi:hypothetical protein